MGIGKVAIFEIVRQLKPFSERVFEFLKLNASAISEMAVVETSLIHRCTILRFIAGLCFIFLVIIVCFDIQVMKLWSRTRPLTSNINM